MQFFLYILFSFMCFFFFWWCRSSARLSLQIKSICAFREIITFILPVKYFGKHFHPLSSRLRLLVINRRSWHAIAKCLWENKSKICSFSYNFLFFFLRFDWTLRMETFVAYQNTCVSNFPFRLVLLLESKLKNIFDSLYVRNHTLLYSVD